LRVFFVAFCTTIPSKATGNSASLSTITHIQMFGVLFRVVHFAQRCSFGARSVYAWSSHKSVFALDDELVRQVSCFHYVKTEKAYVFLRIRFFVLNLRACILVACD
jgi:hypothetical protein